MTEVVIPTFRELVSAKVVDSLLELEERREANDISEGEWYVARQTMFTAFSGFMTRDILELMATSEPQGFKERIR